MESYGSVGSFDAGTYFKTPRVIIRLLSLVFSIVVFGCIADGVAGHGPGDCAYGDGDLNACGYGIAVGVIAFLGCLAFLIVDGFYEQKDDVFKKRSTIADLAFSLLWTFMWFVGFCYLTDRWRTAHKSEYRTKIRDSAQAAIAFSFFSIASWAVLTVMAFRRLRQINADNFGYTEPPPTGDAGYSSFPAQADLSESYQKPPFTDD
eukprot:m.310012 g.310012  ORF g.310012 m.310012 type:complete len:205 (+) comp49109_c0_seq1:48-662(+)